VSDIGPLKVFVALSIFLCPFVAAYVTIRLGVKLRDHTEHQKRGLWLILLPPAVFLFFCLLILSLTVKPLIEFLSWQVHFIPAAAFVLIEALLLRTLSEGQFLFHAAIATILCAASAYVIFSLIFL